MTIEKRIGRVTVRLAIVNARYCRDPSIVGEGSLILVEASSKISANQINEV